MSSTPPPLPPPPIQNFHPKRSRWTASQIASSVMGTTLVLSILCGIFFRSATSSAGGNWFAASTVSDLERDGYREGPLGPTTAAGIRYQIRHEHLHDVDLVGRAMIRPGLKGSVEFLGVCVDRPTGEVLCYSGLLIQGRFYVNSLRVLRLP